MEHLHELIAGILALQEDALIVVNRLLDGMERIDNELGEDDDAEGQGLGPLLELGEEMLEDGDPFQLQGQRDPLNFSLGYVLADFFRDERERNLNEEEQSEEHHDLESTPVLDMREREEFDELEGREEDVNGEQPPGADSSCNRTPTSLEAEASDEPD